MLQVLKVQPGSAGWSSVTLPARDVQIVRAQVSPRDDYAVTSVYSPDGINRGTTQSLYTIKILADGKLAEPKMVAFANLPYGQDRPAVALPSSGYVLAYVNEGLDLHAVFYDGSGDTLVASNVGAVWSLKAKGDLAWWR